MQEIEVLRYCKHYLPSLFIAFAQCQAAYPLSLIVIESGICHQVIHGADIPLPLAGRG